ncbi:chromosomal replication initiator protein DnaA [Marinibacterium profundimaris]|uniref:Chromosomal replication initiator protein DnaA n=1 Tax=Marinibacterium profundimaris TaxID=1679460 RepID=A0A225NHI4_9RHOB|nr:chromosomal replication initiator DnaA [Marinibacterium profundimaris]OWU73046.1 chromosomal replication initiator protein DnaA [Marinibacterium profundimaris]
MPRQLSFDLPVRPALGRDDFFVAPSNALAIDLIDRTLDLPGRKLAISGLPGAGKTHLAHVWATEYAEYGARILPAAALDEDIVPDLAQTAMAIEDVPAIAGDPVRERALFHLHNMLAERGLPLLLTGRAAPQTWGLHLPDLKSRIAAAAHAALEAPDDALLAAVMMKLFADRQLSPKPDVIPYAVRHMERSFAAATDLVDRLDRAALEAGRDVTRALTTEVLGSRASPH